MRGAKAIAETGILDDVDYMFGVHMWSREEGGDDQIGFSYNESMANAKIDVLLHGNAAHATQPELGNNAMLAQPAISFSASTASRARLSAIPRSTSV